MSQEQNNYTPPERDPWDSNVYRNGSTKPPKNHGGIVAVLLVAVILLSGITSVLSFMNIRLFKQMDSPEAENDMLVISNNAKNTEAPAMSVSVEEPTAGTTQAVDAETSPISVDNVPEEGGMSLQAIYQQLIPSVVSISSSYTGGSATGTGLILSEDGYIVTNCHVVEHGEVFHVLLTDGRTIEASLVGTDAISDLAVLHISADNLVAAQLGDSASLRVGDTVVAIGDPLGVELRGTMTDGIISAINRDIDVDGRTMSLIQTNAALNSGNSGGPLINCYGQVIGINTIKIGGSISTLGVEGLGFAIPSATVEVIVNELIEKGFVSGRPGLGITGESVSNFYQFYYRLPQGLYITEVEPGSTADQVGIKAEDILLSIDNTRITGMDSYQTALYAYEPGDTVRIVIYRAGKQYSATVTMGEATG